MRPISAFKFQLSAFLLAFGLQLSAFGQQTTVLYDAADNTLKRPAADLLKAANGIGDVTGPASSTSNEVAVYSGATGKILKQADGAITITAGGSNQSVTVTPSGTGGLGVGIAGATTARLRVASISATTPITAWINNGTPLFALYSETSTTGDGDIIMPMASGSTRPRLVGRRGRGTLAVPTTIVTGDTIFSLIGSAYDGTSFIDMAAIDFSAEGTVTTGQVPMNITFSAGTTSRLQAVKIDSVGRTTFGVGARSAPAWGTTGLITAAQGTQTYTDSSTASSGTAAIAVFHSFQVPNLAASNTLVTTTTAANVYIAGDVGASANQTLTNSYGLWNVGKTRLDSGIYLGGTTPGVIAGSSGGITLTANGTNQSITATTSGTGSIDLLTNSSVRIGTSSGSGNTILYQTGSAILNSGNVALVLKRTSANAGLQFNDSADSGAARITASTTPSLDITNGAASVFWARFSAGSLAIGDTTSSIIGAAGNMTITAGTGASRTLTFQTTTSGSTATTALTLTATQTATFAQTVATRAPTGGTSAAWALGTVAVVSPTSPNRTVEVEVGGTTYYVAAKTTNN